MNWRHGEGAELGEEAAGRSSENKTHINYSQGNHQKYKDMFNKKQTKMAAAKDNYGNSPTYETINYDQKHTS